MIQNGVNISQIALIGGLILSALTIISNIIISYLNKRIEAKKDIYRTVIDCSYKEWEASGKLVMEIAEKTNRRATIVPFSQYLLYYSRYFKLLEKKNINKKDIENFHNEIKRLNRELITEDGIRNNSVSEKIQ